MSQAPAAPARPLAQGATQMEKEKSIPATPTPTGSSVPADASAAPLPTMWSEVAPEEVQQGALMVAMALTPGRGIQMAGRAAAGPGKGADSDASIVPVAVLAAAETSDPLGMGRLDPATLRLVEPRAARPAALRAGAPARAAAADAAAVLPTSKSFDPDAYLGTVHGATPRVRLEAGMATLSEELSERTAQLRALVRDNFARFMSCKGAIDGIYGRLRVKDSGGVASTRALLDTISQAEQSARKALDPLLERQERTERLRASMAALRKHSAAVFLPSRMLERAGRGDFAGALEDFRGCRHLLAPPQPGATGGAVWAGLVREARGALRQVGHMAQAHLCASAGDAGEVARALVALRGIAQELGPEAVRPPKRQAEGEGGGAPPLVPLDPEPGRLLVRTICARGVREVQKTHGKLQRALKRLEGEGAPRRARTTALVRAAVRVSQATTDCVRLAWRLANTPAVLEAAAAFPVFGPRGAARHAAKRSIGSDADLAGAGAGAGDAGPSRLGPGGRGGRGAVAGTPDRDRRAMHRMSSVAAQSLSRARSSVASLHADPLGTEAGTAHLIDEFSRVAGDILERVVRLSTEATAEAGGDDGTVGDMAPVASLVRALGAARRQLLATGAAGGTDTSSSTSPPSPVAPVSAEAVDAVDALLRRLVEASASAAARRLSTAVDAALAEHPGACAAALAESVDGPSARALLALLQPAPGHEAASALVVQLEGAATPDGPGAPDPDLERTALVAWLRGALRAAVCSVESAARDADAAGTGLLFDATALVDAAWGAVARAAAFLELCCSKGAAPPGPDGERVAAPAPGAPPVGSPEWALASLRSVSGLEALCAWLDSRLAPLLMHSPGRAAPVPPAPATCLSALSAARAAVMAHFSSSAASRVRALVREWVASVARVPVLSVDLLDDPDGDEAAGVRAWGVPAGARGECARVVDYLCRVAGDLSRSAPDQRLAVLGALVRGALGEAGRAAEALLQGTLEAPAPGGGLAPLSLAWRVQRRVSVCAYCQLRLELEVLDEATAAFRTPDTEAALFAALEALAEAAVVTEEDQALLGLDAEAGVAAGPLAEDAYGAVAAPLLPAALERMALATRCLDAG